MSKRFLPVLGWALLLWFVGMLVGSVVFAVPQLKEAQAIPWVTANPFITVPILVLWPLLVWIITRKRVANSQHPRSEGVKVGLVFLAVNVVLDFVLVVNVMQA